LPATYVQAESALKETVTDEELATVALGVASALTAPALVATPSSTSADTASEATTLWVK
jgi:hypothetical protein